MATSSITKNFVISGKEQVEVAAREIKGEPELREMMRLRKMKIKEKENAGK